MTAVKNATFMLIGVFVTLLGSALVVYAPKFRLGGGTVVLYGRTALQSGADPELTKLLADQLATVQRENEGLKDLVKKSVERADKAEREREKLANAPSANAVNTQSAPVTDLRIDLVKYLGPYAYTTGISYDPYVCFPPLEVAFEKSTPAERKAAGERALKDLIAELAKIHGVKPEAIKADKAYYEQEFTGGKLSSTLETAMAPMTEDPKYQEWRRAISRVLARYLCHHNGQLHYSGTTGYDCPGRPSREEIATLGSSCRSVQWEKAVERFGYFNQPFTNLNTIARAIVEGTCTTHIRNHSESYAHWVVKERMAEKWKTFQVDNTEQDKVVFLFDMLYEKMLMFTRQYWMGVVTMQNPFDLYSIQDIIYTTKPDLLIETGTANGGSALMWAGIMELAGLEDSKILTLDLVEPVWKDGQLGWGGGIIAREDPTKNKHWTKRVTFVKGYTTAPEVLAQVRKAAEGKKSIMVTLDSGHNKEHVADELKAYCPLVTVGSYCIVEDTKMSRWHSTGPLEAVKEFLVEHPEFQMDRGKELMYSHHTMGYLKRIR